MANAITENKEKLIGMGRAAALHGMHRSTFIRWILKGPPSGLGEKFRLEAVRRGYVWFTSEEAISRFFERLSQVERPSEEGAETAEAKPASRLKKAEAASREMELAGA